MTIELSQQMINEVFERERERETGALIQIVWDYTSSSRRDGPVAPAPVPSYHHIPSLPGQSLYCSVQRTNEGWAVLAPTDLPLILLTP